MVRCGVSPGETGNVAAQDSSVSLSAVEMSSAETAEEHPSAFANISVLVCDHSYLPTRFGGLVENTLVYIAGFVVRQVLRKLSCDVCHVSLVGEAVPSLFDKSYHLLALKNNGGLVIPSQGTVKVLRAAERVIRQLQQCRLQRCRQLHTSSGRRLERRMFFCLGNTLRRHSLALTTIILTCCHWLWLCFSR
ncbi:hypothetical protein AALO_G00206960 [Alosa alosa]|uniref:Uncharacterized protein n=1 Tax=Alosa alosa TaxID=278164 RepID=A0AAV6G8P6_9TELE|nr:hypothetical protein AALO_G00206960 [Alosa alosa]